MRAFKRYSRKHPGLIKDIEKTLKLLVEDPFAPPLETHNPNDLNSINDPNDLNEIFEF